MANNCLITKLKGVVDNENLDYFDTIKVKRVFIESATSSDLTISVVNTHGLKLMSTGTIYPPNQSNVLPNGNDTVLIYDKSSLSELRAGKCTEIQTKDLNYCTNLNVLHCLGLKGDVSEMETLAKNTKTNTFVFFKAQDNLTGDVMKLFETCKIESSVVEIWEAFTLTGDISRLGRLINLNIIMVDNTSVYGTVEELVSSFISHGSNGMTINFGVSAGQVTFRGKLMDHTGLGDYRLLRKWLRYDQSGNITILAGNDGPDTDITNLY